MTPMVRSFVKFDETYPVVLIVGVSNVTASVNNILVSATRHPFSKEIPSLCLLIILNKYTEI